MSREQIDQQLCNAIVNALKSDLSSADSASLVVSGGSTPVRLFKLLSETALEWSKVQVTLADERFLPPSHEDANAKLVHEHLLVNRAVEARFIPLVLNPADHDLNLTQALEAFQTIQQPFSAVVLGMGADGHFASLFPGSEGVDAALGTEYEGSALLDVVPKAAPYRRISMSLKALVNCRHLFLHCYGDEKASVINRAKKGSDHNLPVSYLLNQSVITPEIYWAE